jgi:hypothetical protein
MSVNKKEYFQTFIIFLFFAIVNFESISRLSLHMKKSLIVLVGLLISAAPISAFANFSDVPEIHPQYAAIISLKNLEIVNGYQDGTFGPQNPVTRAEAVKMLLNSAKVEVDESATTEPPFVDVTTDAWFAPFTAKAKELTIVKGYGDTGEFQPNRQVSKAEFIKMLLQSFNKDITKHAGAGKLSPDTEAGQWYLPHLSFARTIGIISPQGNGNLEPNKQLTRAETADIIYKLLILERGGDVQKLLRISESSLISLLVDLSNNDLASAKTHADTAVASTTQALQQKPDEGIVKAAHKISLGFQKLVFAYEAGLSNDYTRLEQLVNEAKDLAGQAFNDDSSTQGLGKKIKEQGDVLLGQIPTGTPAE